ncbi:MAG: DUF5004 domain-containing protein [Bacteroidota bacterium]|nr:DUF5004 domain-containing protein [Bacteroidota bacterium]
MKKKILNTMSLLLAGAMLFSCDSDSENNCPENFTGALLAEEELLVGEWRLTGVMSAKEIDLTDDDTDNPSKDVFAQYDECERDAIYIFKTDRSYTYELGRNTDDCDYSIPSRGTWQLRSKNLSLVTSCQLFITGLELNEDETEFLYSNVYNITDVDGSIIQTNIEFTYTLVP